MYSLIVASGGKFQVLTLDGHVRTLNLQGSVLKLEKKDAFKAIDLNIFGRYFGISKQFLISNDSKILNDAKCCVVKVFDSFNWAVRGSDSGQILLFKILNEQGHLVKSWDGHFNAVKALAVPINENGFYSAGSDGCICYYSLSTLKMTSWNAHSAPIIGLNLSRSISLENSFIWSLSLDKKCKMWNSKGKLIKSWNILEIPSTFSVNSLETWIFIGTNTGIVFGVSVGSDQNLVDAKSSPLVYNSNDNIPISSLELSLDEQYLITGNKAGLVKVWDMANQMCLNSVSFDVEIIGIKSVLNPLLDPDGIPKSNLKKLDKYPMSKELQGNIFLPSISVRDEPLDEPIKSINIDKSLQRLEQENANLKTLNANLFTSAITALSQKTISQI